MYKVHVGSVCSCVSWKIHTLHCQLQQSSKTQNHHSYVLHGQPLKQMAMSIVHNQHGERKNAMLISLLFKINHRKWAYYNPTHNIDDSRHPSTNSEHQRQCFVLNYFTTYAHNYSSEEEEEEKGGIDTHKQIAKQQPMQKENSFAHSFNPFMHMHHLFSLSVTKKEVLNHFMCVLHLKMNSARQSPKLSYFQLLSLRNLLPKKRCEHFLLIHNTSFGAPPK